MSGVLFILKRRQDYNAVVHSAIGMSTGLYNSAKFMNDMLIDGGVESEIVVVEDYNKIDRQVYLYKPTHVILEAIWVTPSKIAELQKLHPKVTWVVRVHSEMPFLAGEGQAIDWVGDYMDCKNVVIAANAPRMLGELRTLYKAKHPTKPADNTVIYLPNFYPQEYKTKKLDKTKETIDIACFGAIRPLKNHLLQAFAAVEFAERIGKKLRFHVNAGRIEMQGGPVIKNLKSFFQQIHGSGHQMINHSWRPREEFLELCSQMDLGLQVSFSETFNIVGCDLISQGVPLIGTAEEIPWAVHGWCADPTNSQDIANKLKSAYKWPKLNVISNQMSLTHYTNKTAKIWRKYFS